VGCTRRGRTHSTRRSGAYAQVARQLPQERPACRRGLGAECVQDAGHVRLLGTGLLEVRLELSRVRTVRGVRSAGWRGGGGSRVTATGRTNDLNAEATSPTTGAERLVPTTETSGTAAMGHPLARDWRSVPVSK
jgi:hypothetical protein